MLKRIQMYIHKNRNIINISVFTFISIILLFISWLLDYQNVYLKSNIPSIVLLSKDVSSSFLSSLSGVFLTVTTFTFTTILTVLNKYSSSYTPRVVQDFIDQPFVLSLFGIFIGGFFYTVLSLFMIQNVHPDSKVISGTIGIFYAMASMIYFILFVRTVLKCIKLSNVIENIYIKASSLIKKDAEIRNENSAFYEMKAKKSFKIFSNSSGYLYNVDDNNIAKLISNFESNFIVNYKLGDYISENTHIADLHFLEEINLKADEVEKLLEEIKESFIFSDTINDKEDFRHEIKNLVEIALRAISPGINDPNTAIICIRKISMLLSDIFSVNNNFRIFEVNNKAKIAYKLYSVEEELYLTFYQLISYGKNDPSIARAFLEGINLIYINSDKSALKEIKDFYNYVYNICIKSMDEELDIKKLKELNSKFNKITQETLN